ncbi:MAG: alpha/beta fold hydrolase [Stellaceae bacterium]
MVKALETGGVTLHRRGQGPPLMLLHCLGVDHKLWDMACAGLERDFTLLAYDFPGHGEAAVPAGRYGIEQLSAQLEALLRRAGIARASLAGISLGGLVAQDFAARRPDLVDKLVLIDTTPRYTDEMRGMWAQRAAQARQAGVRALIPGLLDIWFTKEFLAGNPEAVRYVRGCFENCSGEGYALACEALAAADLCDGAPRIKAPALVVCGQQDIPSFLDSAAWLTSNIKGARLEWLGPARHCSILEQPDSFRKILREFLL